MGVLLELMWIGVHLACVAIDMALILLLLRIVGQWRRIGWVETINRAADEPVNRLIAGVGRQWQQLTATPLSAKGMLALSLATLCLARFVLCGLEGLLLT